MPLPYYDRLSAKQRAIYQRSAGVRRLAVPDVESLAPLILELETCLSGGLPRPTGRAAHRLLSAMTDQFGVRAVGKTRVHSVRPTSQTGELHGLYERETDGTTQITVWMRTAARSQVVAYRTFLRTLLHELVHHLDYELLRLPDTLHTEGFFARESSLMRQLAPAPIESVVVDPQLELPW